MTNKMSINQARAYFGETSPRQTNQPTSKLEADLRAKSIAGFDLGVETDTFQKLSDEYDVCITNHQDYLNKTAGRFDSTGVPEDGHVRKEIKFNHADMQVSDPKNLFHFNDPLIDKIHQTDMLKNAPSEFSEFMTHGIDLHRTLVGRAKKLVETLDQSYERMSELYFPKSHQLGKVTLRLLRYDGYPLRNDNGELVALNGEQVAKGHYDRGGLTIQAYASAPGFWIHPEPKDGSRRRPTTDQDKIYPPHGLGESQVFSAAMHGKIYGSKDPISRLYHGVDRIIEEEVAENDYMPARTAVIAFVDTPVVDTKVTMRDTQPDRINQPNPN